MKKSLTPEPLAKRGG